MRMRRIVFLCFLVSVRVYNLGRTYSVRKKKVLGSTVVPHRVEHRCGHELEEVRVIEQDCVCIRHISHTAVR